MSKTKEKPKRLSLPNLSALRGEGDAGAQFAIAWAEMSGYRLAVFRREGGIGGRVFIQLGPAPDVPKRGQISKTMVARSILAGVLFLDVQLRRRHELFTALAWLRALEA